VTLDVKEHLALFTSYVFIVDRCRHKEPCDVSHGSRNAPDSTLGRQRRPGPTCRRSVPVDETAPRRETVVYDGPDGPHRETAGQEPVDQIGRTFFTRLLSLSRSGCYHL